MTREKIIPYFDTTFDIFFKKFINNKGAAASLDIVMFGMELMADCFLDVRQTVSAGFCDRVPRVGMTSRGATVLTSTG